MTEITPIHYESGDTPLFGNEPRLVRRGNTVYQAYPQERKDPQTMADETINRMKIGVVTPEQRAVIEKIMRPIVEAEFGLHPACQS